MPLGVGTPHQPVLGYAAHPHPLCTLKGDARASKDKLALRCTLSLGVFVHMPLLAVGPRTFTKPAPLGRDGFCY